MNVHILHVNLLIYTYVYIYGRGPQHITFRQGAFILFKQGVRPGLEDRSSGNWGRDWDGDRGDGIRGRDHQLWHPLQGQNTNVVTSREGGRVYWPTLSNGDVH